MQTGVSFPYHYKMNFAFLFSLLNTAVLFSHAAASGYSGLVFADRNANGLCDLGERGVPDVAVSDGLHVVKTDRHGRYTLPGHDRERFIFITLPSGAKAFPFYRRIEQGRNRYDFALMPNQQSQASSGHRFLHVTDTEIFNTRDHEDWVGGVRDYARNSGASFVIHTGDICYEEGLKKHIGLMNTGNFPCPVYYCIGNHDLVDGEYGEEVFESVYGPVFYSFEAGNTHYVVTPMLGGDRRPGYSQEDVSRWLKNDLAQLPRGKSVVVFSHDLLTGGERFLYGAGEHAVDLNMHNLKAWIYGHRHTNHIRKQGNVFTICTGTVDKGGIDHSMAAFRDITVDGQGRLSSSLRHVYVHKALQVASVQNGKSPLAADGSMTVSVNAYHAGSPVRGVACTLSIGGRKAAEVHLSPRTSWNWAASVPVPPGSMGKEAVLRVRADFGPEGTAETEETFVCVPTGGKDVKTGRDWGNLLGNPEHVGTVEDAPLPPYELAWVSNIGGNIHMASPLVSGSRVFVATADEDMKGEACLGALDVETGRVLWKYPVRNSIKNTIAHDGNTVLAQDADGWLYAVDGETGRLRWERKLPVRETSGLVEGLVAGGGKVYAGTGRGLTACSVRDGRVLWTNSGWGQHEGATTTLSLGNGVLIAGSQWQALFGNDAETGRLLWKNGGNGLRNRGASAAIHGSKAYLTSWDALFILDIRTGSILKQANLPISVDVTSTPLVTDREIIFGTARDGLMALDRQTLKEKWRYATGDALVYTAPYTRKASRTIESSPVQVGGYVLATASDGSFSAIDRKTGRLVWSAKTGAPFFSSPAVSGNAVFVADFSGNVYAFIRREHTIVTNDKMAGFHAERRGAVGGKDAAPEEISPQRQAGGESSAWDNISNKKRINSYE